MGTIVDHQSVIFEIGRWVTGGTRGADGAIGEKQRLALELEGTDRHRNEQQQRHLVPLAALVVKGVVPLISYLARLGRSPWSPRARKSKRFACQIPIPIPNPHPFCWTE